MVVQPKHCVVFVRGTQRRICRLDLRCAGYLEPIIGSNVVPSPMLRSPLICASGCCALLCVLGGCASCETSRVAHAAANMMPPPTANRTNLSARGSRITRPLRTRTSGWRVMSQSCSRPNLPPTRASGIDAPMRVRTPSRWGFPGDAGTRGLWPAALGPLKGRGCTCLFVCSCYMIVCTLVLSSMEFIAGFRCPGDFN